MYRYLQLFLFCVFTNAVSFAQTNQVEAKAAYLLAEESYAKGDMKSTVQYLDEAGNKLGSVNAKILYLKIMAQRELANADQNYFAKLDSTIALFQKSPDVNTFNEDKVLEVAKIKLQLKKEIDQKKIYNESRAGISGVERDYPDWPLGASLAALRAKHPDIFQMLDSKAYKKYIEGNHYMIPHARNGVDGFRIVNDRLSELAVTLYFLDNDEIDHVKGKEAFAKFLEDFQQRLGKRSPEITERTGVHIKSCYWEEGTKAILLQGYFSDPSLSTVSISIFDHSVK